MRNTRYLRGAGPSVMPVNIINNPMGQARQIRVPRFTDEDTEAQRPIASKHPKQDPTPALLSSRLCCFQSPGPWDSPRPPSLWVQVSVVMQKWTVPPCRALRQGL